MKSILQSIRRFFRRKQTPEQQRLEVYYLMLKYIKSNISFFGGLCFTLERVSRNLHNKYGETTAPFIEQYPELISRKPADVSVHSYAWWFPPNESAPRLKILQEAINELKFKISNTPLT